MLGRHMWCRDPLEPWNLTVASHEALRPGRIVVACSTAASRPLRVETGQ